MTSHIYSITFLNKRLNSSREVVKLSSMKRCSQTHKKKSVKRQSLKKQTLKKDLAASIMFLKKRGKPIGLNRKYFTEKSATLEISIQVSHADVKCRMEWN